MSKLSDSRAWDILLKKAEEDYENGIRHLAIREDKWEEEEREKYPTFIMVNSIAKTNYPTISQQKKPLTLFQRFRKNIKK